MTPAGLLTEFGHFHRCDYFLDRASIDHRSSYVPSARQWPAIESRAGNARTARKVILSTRRRAGGSNAADVEPGGRQLLRCSQGSQSGSRRSVPSDPVRFDRQNAKAVRLKTLADQQTLN